MDVPAEFLSVRARTTAALVAAARRAFGAHGFYRTTVEDVAREAGVARSTFYRYFNSLDEVLVQLAETELGQAFAEARAVAEAHETLADQFAAAALYITTHSGQWLRQFGLEDDMVRTTNLLYAVAPDFLVRASSVFRPVLEQGRDRGELRPELSFDEVVEWLMQNTWYLRYIRRGSDPESFIRNMITRLVVPALLAPDARPST